MNVNEWLFYPRPERDKFENAFDGEEEGEHQVEVTQDVGEVEGGSVELKMFFEKFRLRKSWDQRLNY
jgi:hypothetical protein